MNTKQHWETIYQTKTSQEVSWTQEKPEVSLQLIREANLSKSAKIIDVGGGDSLLVDFLLEEGYTDITVLDLSSHAIEKAKQRLGARAESVKWIVEDVTTFQPTEIYDLWHDRAAFHFLTLKEDVKKYSNVTGKYVSRNLIIGTFSKQGPTKCSGLTISQYDDSGLINVFKDHFHKINCFTTDHQTPFGTYQNFQFCSFKRQKKSFKITSVLSRTLLL